MNKCITTTLGIVVLLIAIGLSGCLLDEVSSFTCDNRLLGIWKDRRTGKETIIFYPDGTWDSTGLDGTWTIEDEKLIITSGDDNSVVYTYDYSFSNNNTLTLTRSNGDSTIYIKQ